jgi:hypothetical protein
MSRGTKEPPGPAISQALERALSHKGSCPRRPMSSGCPLVKWSTSYRRVRNMLTLQGQGLRSKPAWTMGAIVDSDLRREINWEGCAFH